MRSSIQKKIMMLSLSGLLICTTLLGGLCMVFVTDSTKKSSQQYLEDQANNVATRISSKFFNVEMYTKALTAGILKIFNRMDILGKDSLREAYTEEIYQRINGTIKNEEKAVAVYLRFNPKLAPPTSGIFMAKTKKDGPIEKLVPTDFSKYDSNDIEHVGWYYIPIKSKDPLWMNPYYNKNIDIYMISYVLPLYVEGQEFGVAGVDLDFNALTEEIKNFQYFKTGYAFLEDNEGKIVFHKSLPQGSVYKDDGSNAITRKPLINGMTVVLVAPYSEINAERNKLLIQIILFGFIVLLVFGSLSIYISGTISKPLKKLTLLANKLTEGDMSVEFDIHQNDEIGELGVSFTKAKHHIQEHLKQMRGLAFRDSLTGVRNKTAYDDYINDFEEKITKGEINKYGIAILDTNCLKEINDHFGHENGNVYLINCCKLICQIFSHSPVFRIGGDEFAIILLNKDLEHRIQLLEALRQGMTETMNATNPWERLSIACGIAVCDDSKKQTITEIFNRADNEMYKDKTTSKNITAALKEKDKQQS